jgi:hypothetical protein
LKRGVTTEQLVRYGEWLTARALRARRVRASIS